MQQVFTGQLLLSSSQ